MNSGVGPINRLQLRYSVSDCLATDAVLATQLKVAVMASLPQQQGTYPICQTSHWVANLRLSPSEGVLRPTVPCTSQSRLKAH
jgi:hypothetical protein